MLYPDNAGAAENRTLHFILFYFSVRQRQTRSQRRASEKERHWAGSVRLNVDVRVGFAHTHTLNVDACSPAITSRERSIFEYAPKWLGHRRNSFEHRIESVFPFRRRQMGKIVLHETNKCQRSTTLGGVSVSRNVRRSKMLHKDNRKSCINFRELNGLSSN